MEAIVMPLLGFENAAMLGTYKLTFDYGGDQFYISLIRKGVQGVPCTNKQIKT